MDRNPNGTHTSEGEILSNVLRWLTDEGGGRRWPHLHLSYGRSSVICHSIHFQASNNVVEYEALVNDQHIIVELGIQCLNVWGDS